MPRGSIDDVSEDGLVTGWASGPDPCVPAIVRVAVDDAVLAEAEASQFRADVLAAGIGHGHYGFRARMAVTPAPGRYRFKLVDADGVVLVEAADCLVPTQRPPERLSVEALLSKGPCWSDEAVAAQLACLNLAENCRSMGITRFVDAGFRFVLSRPVDPLSASYYGPALQRGAVTPDSFIAGLLRSADRKSLGTPLPSPYDYRFPFALVAG